MIVEIYKIDLEIWAQLLETNDIVSEQFIKFSNIFYVKHLSFCRKNVMSFCSAKTPLILSAKKLEHP